MKMTICTLLIVRLMPSASAFDDAEVAASAYVKASEIYVVMAGSGETRQITKDGVGKGDVVLSNDGRRIAFVRETHLKELSNIVVLQLDGKVLQDIHFRPEEANILGMRYVEGLEWMTNRLLVVSGSVNPSIGEYAVIDVSTGKEVADYVVDGYTFTPSPDASQVAYERSIPHFTWEEHRRPQLCLDDECGPTPAARGGYPSPNRHIEFTNKPVWSPDGTKVAVTAEDYTTKEQSVIVREAGGKTAEFAAPQEVGAGLSFGWEDSTIRIKTANGEWKLQPGKSGSLVWFRMK
jgi:hypothetical protein